ncbi:hypothetical protein ABZN20_02165 [Methylococcus sp. ANG]|uniref:hypothetical protein n=1 Tax=Methylococcus sp. ANG TaxID=3231903 RepID=UPI00345AFE44
MSLLDATKLLDGKSSAQQVAPTTPALPFGAKDAKGLNATILSRQQQHFEDLYLPLEKQTLKWALNQNADNAAGAQANAQARTGAAMSREQFMRNLSRSGSAVDPNVMQQADRSMDMAKALGTAGATNLAQRGTYDAQLSTLSQAVDIGRGVASNAAAAAGSASALAQQRTAAALQARNAERANEAAASSANMQMGVSIAMALAMAAAIA